MDFSKEQQARARGTFAGLREHTVEIQQFESICGPKLKEAKDKLKNYWKNIKILNNISIK